MQVQPPAPSPAPPPPALSPPPDMLVFPLPLETRLSSATGSAAEQQAISSLRASSGEANTASDAGSSSQPDNHSLTLYAMVGFALSLAMFLASKFLTGQRKFDTRAGLRTQSKPGRKLAAGGGGEPERLQQSCDDDVEMDIGMVGDAHAADPKIRSARAQHPPPVDNTIGDDDETILALEYHPQEESASIEDANETVLALDYHPRIESAMEDEDRDEDDEVTHVVRPKMKKKRGKKVFGKRYWR